MIDKPQTAPPELIKAKKVLDDIMAIQPSYEGMPTEEQAAAMHKLIYHKRMMVIYLELENTAMEARSEQHN